MEKLVISSKLEKALFTMNELTEIISDESMRIQDLSLKNQTEVSNKFMDLMSESMTLVGELIADEILSQVK
ncbi:hypothetical protein SDC9_49584 [bioreactor metagenome]|uniref:Uncharacterized protein n=1 Tax=bioreactor metagenome TaxID=1076179 RepID=A0A644WI93_9ZZZZ|nr:hypothetical protein [Macellibacteroides fermentans]